MLNNRPAIGSSPESEIFTSPSRDCFEIGVSQQQQSEMQGYHKRVCLHGEIPTHFAMSELLLPSGTYAGSGAVQVGLCVLSLVGCLLPALSPSASCNIFPKVVGS